MELSQQIIIEVALNIVGYLAAGALSILIYRNFARPAGRNTTSPEVESERAMKSEPLTESAPPRELTRSVEFINFGTGVSSRPASPAKMLSNSTVRGGANAAVRRDRADIIRIAKEMMKAGATAEKIKGVIPISEAELSLLSMGKTAEAGR